MTSDIESLDKLVQLLHDQGAWHKTRGYRLDEAPIEKITNSILEEATEFQAECFFGDYHKQIGEAADLLGAFLHGLYKQGIPLPVVIARSDQKLREIFTTDHSKVIAVEPGFTRSGRPQPRSGRPKPTSE